MDTVVGEPVDGRFKRSLGGAHHRRFLFDPLLVADKEHVVHGGEELYQSELQMREA
jgi:hypothetical protein